MRFGFSFTPLRLMASGLLEAFQLLRRGPALLSTSRPAETVRLFIRHIDQGRFRDAIRLFPDTLVRVLGVDRLETILYQDSAEVRTRGGVTRVDIVQDQWTVRAAEVMVNIHYADGSTDSEQIALTNQMGEWKIDMMH